MARPTCTTRYVRLCVRLVQSVARYHVCSQFQLQGNQWAQREHWDRDILGPDWSTSVFRTCALVKGTAEDGGTLRPSHTYRTLVKSAQQPIMLIRTFANLYSYFVLINKSAKNATCERLHTPVSYAVQTDKLPGMYGVCVPQLASHAELFRNLPRSCLVRQEHVGGLMFCFCQWSWLVLEPVKMTERHSTDVYVCLHRFEMITVLLIFNYISS